MLVFGNLDPVDLPGDLVPAAHMQLVVHEVRAGDVVRDHCEAVAAIGTRGDLDILPIDEGTRGESIRVGQCGRTHRDRLQRLAGAELNMGRRGSACHDGQRQRSSSQTRSTDVQNIVAQWHARKSRTRHRRRSARCCDHAEVAALSCTFAEHGTVLRIMHNTVDITEICRMHNGRRKEHANHEDERSLRIVRPARRTNETP